MASPKFTVVGTLDFLPKVTIPSLAAALSGEPTYLWWYNFLIKTSAAVELLAKMDGFVVIDNIDEEWFLVKAINRPTPYLLVNDGPVPAVISEAETIPDTYLHIVDGNDRQMVVEQVKSLIAKYNATEVYVALTVSPDLLVAKCAYHE